MARFRARKGPRGKFYIAVTKTADGPANFGSGSRKRQGRLPFLYQGETLSPEEILAHIAKLMNREIKLVGGRAHDHVAAMEGYIAAHLSDPVRVADMAREAGVSARTLRGCCHRIRDKSPERILREMRLDAAHRRMQYPEPNDTVAAIAARYHFLNPGRFADYYRRQFHGESPAITLQRGRKRRAILETPLD
jgi:AraC-like DNA-binding protein